MIGLGLLSKKITDKIYSKSPMKSLLSGFGAEEAMKKKDELKEKLKQRKRLIG